MSEKQNEMKKLIEKMRTNTNQQNRKTEGAPVRRARRRMAKVRLTDSSEKQKSPEAQLETEVD